MLSQIAPLYMHLYQVCSNGFIPNLKFVAALRNCHKRGAIYHHGDASLLRHSLLNFVFRKCKYEHIIIANMKIVYFIWETPVVCKILSQGVWEQFPHQASTIGRNKLFQTFLLESKLCHKVRMRRGGWTLLPPRSASFPNTSGN